MNDRRGVDLRALNSFGVRARARKLQLVDELDLLPQLAFDPSRDLVLGGGSNVLLAEDIPGTVLQIGLRGRQVFPADGDRARVTLAAGEPWHEAVRWTLREGLSGLENLSLIPGLVGAAPMQNIGAYGVELADHLHTVTAWDWSDRQLRTLDRDDCELSYRDSRFKSREPGRFLITAVTLDLPRRFRPQLAYAGLRETLTQRGIAPEQATALEVSDAVAQLRQGKLPDPARIGNAGSFFKNPVLDEALAASLSQSHPALPLHEVGAGRFKTSAAWLIEHCGWKGFRDGDAGVSSDHALVLVNHGKASGLELLVLAQRIQQDVFDRFGLELEPEPRIIPPDMTPTVDRK